MVICLNVREMTYLMQFDGGANPNPGPCAGAFVIYNTDHEVVAQGSRFMGDGTNNIGEYTGLLLGLEKCVELGLNEVKVEGDSLLVISQMSGKWKVNNAKLAELKTEALKFAKQIQSITYAHIRREFNSFADRLCDEELEKHR